MRTRVEKVRLGIFMVVSTVIVIGVFFTLAGIKFMDRPDVYKAHFNETVSGLETGAEVKYNGVRVGQVSMIRINPEKIAQVTVFLELKSGTPVKADTTAVLTSMGITGLKFVELTGGSDESPFLEPGSTMGTGRSFMGSIEGKAEDIAIKMELAVSKINAVLSEDNISHINDILANLKRLSQSANGLVDQNSENMTAIVNNLAQTSAALNTTMASVGRSAQTTEEILADAKPQVSLLLTNLNQTSATINRTVERFSAVNGVMKQLERTLTKFNNEIHDVDVTNLSDNVQKVLKETDTAVRSIRKLVDASRENIYESSVSLKTTMRNLEDLSRSLRDQPSLLLKSKPPEDLSPADKSKRREQ